MNKENVSAYQTPLSTGLDYICSVQMLGNLRKTEQEKSKNVVTEWIIFNTETASNKECANSNSA